MRLDDTATLVVTVADDALSLAAALEADKMT
jgi:hypothetical protein